MKTLLLVTLCALVTLAALPLQSQTFSYPNFISVTGLHANGTATQGIPVPPETSTVLRLMDGLGSHGQESSVWFQEPVLLVKGFKVEFGFNINSCVVIGCSDGFAFVIQNSVTGLAALGGFGGYLGYSAAPGVAGIDNSLAIEFDDFQNFTLNDPNGNHIAAQSCGTAPNTADHSMCNLSIVPTLPITLPDGANHVVEIAYIPTGDLYTLIDHTPVMHTLVDLGTLLSLPDGKAYIGFTAGAGSGGQNTDILNWSFQVGAP